MRLAAAALLMVAMAGCGGDDDSDETTATTPPVAEAIRLESPAFQDGAELPTRFTCDGEGVSPPLRWSEVPPRARDLALVVDDPDAPGDGFLHWAVWKLPFEPSGEGRVLEDNVAPEMDQAENDAGDPGWAPACPPEGDESHRYVFTLYALDRVIDLGDGASADEVREAIAADAVAEGRLEATYAR
jgi:Raf kinase inhibitor-like YbhB/YbcL family protein